MPPETATPVIEAKTEEPDNSYMKGRRRTTKSQSQAPEKPDDNGEQQEGYEGLAFEVAQAKLISEMMKLKDET